MADPINYRGRNAAGLKRYLNERREPAQPRPNVPKINDKGRMLHGRMIHFIEDTVGQVARICDRTIGCNLLPFIILPANDLTGVAVRLPDVILITGTFNIDHFQQRVMLLHLPGGGKNSPTTVYSDDWLPEQGGLVGIRFAHSDG